MPSFFTLFGAFLGTASLVRGAAVPIAQPFEHVKARRQVSNDTGSGSGLQIDLGYDVYQGYNNQTTGLNIWKGYVRLGFLLVGSLFIDHPSVSVMLHHQRVPSVGNYLKFLQRIVARLSKQPHSRLNVLRAP
jgi:hypothetical protein